MIGIDFDNTIVCYDLVFARAAADLGLSLGPGKSPKAMIRDHLRAAGQEDRWTELQGVVYGPRIADAHPFPGVMEFCARRRAAGMPIAVISHRSRFPYLGERHDLHEAARTWLGRQGFHDPEGIALPPDRVYLEDSLEAKLARIAAAGCTHFIDDLPEVLRHPLFPTGVRRILFDPHGMHEPPTGSQVASSWADIESLVEGDTSP